MRCPLGAAIGVFLLAGSAPLNAQEHGPAHAEPPKTVQTDAVKNVQVTPTLPPAKVAAAVADALREARAAETRRAAPVSIRPILPRRTPVATAPAKRYEVRWPEERMVVQWPGAATDRVTLTWPAAF
jgi:hypothetical protein